VGVPEETATEVVYLPAALDLVKGTDGVEYSWRRTWNVTTARA